MPHRNVTILVDRFDRARAIVDAASVVTQCRITDAAESWSNLDLVQGVIADVPLDRVNTRSCLQTLAQKLDGRRLPLVYLMRTGRDPELRHAERLGATACFPAFTLPKLVVSALFRQIAPAHTMTDLLVKYSFDRAGELFTGMLAPDKATLVDLEHVEAEVDPILRALREGGLRRWLELVHAHDDTTVRHCLLVAGLAANFALHLRLPAPERLALVRAGIIHDVGKSAIPRSILNKPGPLDPDERAVMQKHPEIGHEMLRASGMTDSVALMATRHHHEMLDGSGYPDGLRGEQIGDMVRLLTICDIYAALTEDRPYRAGMSQADALRIIRSMAPHKLEYALVEAFTTSLEDR